MRARRGHAEKRSCGDAVMRDAVIRDAVVRRRGHAETWSWMHGDAVMAHAETRSCEQDAVVWRRGRVETRSCGDAVMWRRGHSETRSCGDAVVMWRRGHAETRSGGDAVVRRRGHARRCDTVSCHDTVSVLHTDTRESQQYLTHMGISFILSPYDDVSNGLCGQCTSCNNWSHACDRRSHPCDRFRPCLSTPSFTVSA